MGRVTHYSSLDMMWFAFVVCFALLVGYCTTGCAGVSAQDQKTACAAARIALKVAQAGVDWACPPEVEAAGQCPTSGGEGE